MRTKYLRIIALVIAAVSVICCLSGCSLISTTCVHKESDENDKLKITLVDSDMSKKSEQTITVTLKNESRFKILYDKVNFDVKRKDGGEWIGINHANVCYFDPIPKYTLESGEETEVTYCIGLPFDVSEKGEYRFTLFYKNEIKEYFESSLYFSIENKWKIPEGVMSIIKPERAFVKRTDGETVIYLKKSGETVRVDEEFLIYEKKITQKAIDKAEEKLLEKINGIGGESPSFYLQKNENGELCLKAEVIQELDYTPDTPELGCGIDHEHLFFEEVILK